MSDTKDTNRSFPVTNTPLCRHKNPLCRHKYPTLIFYMCNGNIKLGSLDQLCLSEWQRAGVELGVTTLSLPSAGEGLAFEGPCAYSKRCAGPAILVSEPTMLGNVSKCHLNNPVARCQPFEILQCERQRRIAWPFFHVVIRWHFCTILVIQSLMFTCNEVMEKKYWHSMYSIYFYSHEVMY